MKNFFLKIIPYLTGKLKTIINIIPNFITAFIYVIRFVIWLLGSWMFGHKHWSSSQSDTDRSNIRLDDPNFDDHMSESIKHDPEGTALHHPGIYNIINILIDFDKALHIHNGGDKGINKNI